MRTKKPPRKFADCFAKYKHYDPKTQGYGSVAEWGAAFDEVMGETEAQQTLGEDNPLFLLGLKVMPLTMDDLKKVYRKLVLQYHPDNGSTPDAARTQKIIAAYSTIKARLERK